MRVAVLVYLAQMHDVGRPRAGRWELELARCRLPLPRVRRPYRRVHPGGGHAHDSGTRQPGAPGVGALAEREHVEAVGPGAQRVHDLGREVDDAIAGADLVGGRRLAVEPPGKARSAEDEEDLLLGQLDVRGRRAHPRVDLPAGDADHDAAGGDAEVSRPGGERPELLALALDLVPVRDEGHQSWSSYQKSPRVPGPPCVPMTGPSTVTKSKEACGRFARTRAARSSTSRSASAWATPTWRVGSSRVDSSKRSARADSALARPRTRLSGVTSPSVMARIGLTLSSCPARPAALPTRPPRTR